MKTTVINPRERIREWWKARIATGEPLDFQVAWKEALKELSEDPEFCRLFFLKVAGEMEVRKIGASLTSSPRTTEQRRYAVGSKMVTREQAVQLVEEELATSPPHWSKLVVRDNHPAWFMALDKATIVEEATRRRADGAQRLHEAAFLIAVANGMTGVQIVSDVWTENELDQLYQMIDVKFTATTKKLSELGGKAA